MKHIWGVLIIVAIATILFTGVSNINTRILATNSELGQDSIDLISKYDTGLNNLSDYQELNIETTLSSNSTNAIAAEYREYAENKNNIQKFKDGLNYFYKIPDIIITSIAVVDVSDSNLSIYRNVTWLLISVIIIIILYKALRGKTDDES